MKWVSNKCKLKEKYLYLFVENDSLWSHLEHAYDYHDTLKLMFDLYQYSHYGLDRSPIDH